MKLGKKERGIIVGTIFVVLLLVLSYTFILPRVQVNTTTVYHQSFSGTSVQSKVENTGTYEITGLRANLSVYDEDGKLVDYANETVSIFEPRNSFKLGFTFTGPQIKSYTVNLTLEFESQGISYTGKDKVVFSYEIKDYMNNNWKEKFTDWRI